MGIIPSSRKRLHELGALHDQLPLHSGARNALRDWFVHVGLLLHDMMWLLDKIPPMHKSSYSLFAAQEQAKHCSRGMRAPHCLEFEVVLLESWQETV